MLKYRWLIIGLTCASILITALAYFILPAVKTNSTSNNSVTTAVIPLNETVTTLAFAPGLELIVQDSNLHYLTITALSNPVMIDAALTTAHLDFGFSNLSSDERLGIIRQELKKSKPSDSVNPWAAELTFREYKATVLNGMISLTIKSPDKEKSEIFINSIINSLNETLLKFLKTTASSIISQGTNSIQISSGTDIAKLNQQRALANAIVNATFTPVTSVMSYTLQEQAQAQAQAQLKNQIKKYGIIGTIGVLFLSIMLAFILQWIASVKNDPEAMQKITAALGKNKAHK